jgi:serine/threonine protein kinase
VALAAEAAAAAQAGAAAAAAMAAAATAAAATVAADIAVREALRRSREPQVYTPAQMEGATDGFNERCKIDEGAYSAVYRGRLQPSGTIVAIKLLKPDAAAVVVAQKKHEQFVGAGSFHNELKVLRKYRHQNLVKLLGFCLSADDEDESKSGGGGGAAAAAAAAAGLQRQCLVLEWIAGGSLRKRLDGSGAALTAEHRFDIASDVARALEFLHITADPPIIHQDVKSDNVLLEEVGGRLIAKVADFGTARSVPELQHDGIDHHSTQMVIGTKPYQPPEYLQSGHTSDKTDTYAFGVVLCELLTGLPPAGKTEVLSTTMSGVLADAKRQLPRLLDKRLGRGVKWPLPRALALGRIARHCIEMKVADRCLVAQKLSELDKLAGRMAVRRAGRGEAYDGMTGQLVRTDRTAVKTR